MTSSSAERQHKKSADRNISVWLYACLSVKELLWSANPKHTIHKQAMMSSITYFSCCLPLLQPSSFLSQRKETLAGIRPSGDRETPGLPRDIFLDSKKKKNTPFKAPRSTCYSTRNEHSSHAHSTPRNEKHQRLKTNDLSSASMPAA